MSFGPKVEDWACSLQKNEELVPVAKTHALYAPRHPFWEKGDVRQRNCVKPPRT
jgi:hypothetical protein